MQKWDYLVLTFDNYFRVQLMEGLKVNYQPIEPTEKGKGLFSSNKYPDWATNLDTCLAHFGEQGWELISVTTEMKETGATRSREFIFKRSKQE